MFVMLMQLCHKVIAVCRSILSVLAEGSAHDRNLVCFIGMSRQSTA